MKLWILDYCCSRVICKDIDYEIDDDIESVEDKITEMGIDASTCSYMITDDDVELEYI